MIIRDEAWWWGWVGQKRIILAWRNYWTGPVFWYAKVFIFWKCIQYAMQDTTQILKKFPSDKVNGTKNALFFSREPHLITVLFWLGILIWAEAKGFSLKNCEWDFPFSISFHFFKTVCFCSTKCMDFLTRHNSFQN